DPAGRAAALLRQLGPTLLEDLRTRLVGGVERRAQERLLWTGPVQASVLRGDGRREAVEAQGKDISAAGMGLYLPRVVPGPRVELDVPTSTPGERVLLAGRFVRMQPCGERWYEAGVVFE